VDLLIGIVVGLVALWLIVVVAGVLLGVGSAIIVGAIDRMASWIAESEARRTAPARAKVAAETNKRLEAERSAREAIAVKEAAVVAAAAFAAIPPDALRKPLSEDDVYAAMELLTNLDELRKRFAELDGASIELMISGPDRSSRTIDLGSQTMNRVMEMERQRIHSDIEDIEQELGAFGVVLKRRVPIPPGSTT
jgi:hypothetical protein